MANLKNSAQSIDELRKRYEQLREEQITAVAYHETARMQLEDLKDEARRLYGTDELDKLRAKLREIEEANERKRSEYQATPGQDRSGPEGSG